MPRKRQSKSRSRSKSRSNSKSRSKSKGKRFVAKSPAQKKKVTKVMSEFYHKKLKSHGDLVTDRNQAIAIALSEASQVR